MSTTESSSNDTSADAQYEQLAQAMIHETSGVKVKDRTYFFKTYPSCFIGSELVDWLIRHNYASDRETAVDIGNVLHRSGLFHHVTDDHILKDETLFYRFRHHDDDFIESLKDGKEGFDDKSVESLVIDMLPPLADGESDTLIQHLTRGFPASDRVVQTDPEDLGLSPLDEYNQELINNVHPEEWINPTPAEMYNVVVIGAGAGGLVTAAGSAGVGAKVAIIEEHLYGGDCLNVGCVPSKALLRCARAVYDAKNAQQFGVSIQGEVTVDFPAVMQRMRRIRAEIAPNDSVERFKSLGIDVFIGRGEFVDKRTIRCGNAELPFAKAVIATGAQAAIPPIPGIYDVPFLTNATLFNLEELPKRFGVIGTGAIGCEMAQAFARFGSEVFLFGRSSTILKTEDQDAAAIVQESLVDSGVTMCLGVTYDSVACNDDGEIVLTVTNSEGAKEQTIVLDQLLIATGRKPNVEGMNLEEIGVDFDSKKGIEVNDFLQTSCSNIYAVGDVCSKLKFTHVSDWHARYVIRNTLFFGRAKHTSLVVPWCTYTSPEIAHVGSYPRELEQQGVDFQTFQVDLADNDRAICDGETEGFVRVHCSGDGKILGATIVAENAGDMISEVTTCIVHDIPMSSQLTVIHPYPTQQDAFRRAGDLYNRTKLTPFVEKVFDNLMKLHR